MAEKMPSGFKRALKKAEKMAGQDDKVPILKLQERASALAKKNKVDLERVWQVLETFIHLVRSWASGEYKDIPWKTIISVIGALIYLVNPFDLIPDWIPIVGYLDDVGIISFVAISVQSDLEKFRSWEKAKVAAS